MEYFTTLAIVLLIAVVAWILWNKREEARLKEIGRSDPHKLLLIVARKWLEAQPHVDWQKLDKHWKEIESELENHQVLEKWIHINKSLQENFTAAFTVLVLEHHLFSDYMLGKIAKSNSRLHKT